MKRTVTALYETQSQAERVGAALVAAKLTDEVDIHDQTAEAAGKFKPQHRTFGEWLSDLFGGHHDSHLYAEGLRRGHVLLTAKVDDLNETRAAEIMDAEAPLDLGDAEVNWRREGWQPAVAPTPDAPPELETAQSDVSAPSRGPYAEPAVPGSSVRAYTL